MFSLMREWLAWAPFRTGMRAVRSAQRDGVQVGEAAKALRTVMPSRARRSMFGVRTSLAPYGPQSRNEKSSAMKRTMCGGVAARAEVIAEKQMRNAMKIIGLRLVITV